MTSKPKDRTPPDLMSELLGSLQEDVPLPSQLSPEPAEPTSEQDTETTKQLADEATSQHSILTTEQHDDRGASRYITGTTELLTDKSTNRLVDLSSRPQTVKAETRKRDGVELTRKTHYLTPDQVRLLKEFAFMTDQGESEVVRQALDEFFERHEHEILTTG